jgi:glycine/D-amino acid oxidase-like deaminating enzyme/nitrite reductase/ring-hydroxylating ferredoxin subunit
MLQLDTTSYWMDAAPLPRFPSLDRDLAVDVAIVGGGITGLTAAYLLKKAGKTVALIDRRRLVSVDTGHTTAHLTYVTDRRLTDLEKSFGRDHARAVWDAGRAALWQIEANVAAENIDCGFEWVTAHLHLAADKDERETADRSSLEAEARLAAELGFDAQFVLSVPLVGTPGIEYEGQALFHPRKYLRALAEIVPGGGSHVFEHTNADEVQDDPLAVVAGGHRISCEHVVLATHTPLVGKANLAWSTLFQTKLALYSTYAIAGKAPAGQVPPGSYWDTADPYSYLRVQREPSHDFAILGGEDHKTGQNEDTNACYERLERRMRALIPGVEITHRWSGQVIETHDGLPYIGETAERQFAGTGFSGNGMTFGTLSGMMGCDAVLGRANPWKDLFDPGRVKIRGGLWDYLKENADYPYYIARDRLAGAEGRLLRSLRRGEGKILDLNGKRVAAYRNDAGAVTQVSPVCTHMGCNVAWNAAERTWDCPCHGSRFEPNGKVIAGPAESPLPRVS